MVLRQQIVENMRQDDEREPAQFVTWCALLCSDIFTTTQSLLSDVVSSVHVDAISDELRRRLSAMVHCSDEQPFSWSDIDHSIQRRRSDQNSRPSLVCQNLLRET